MKVSLFSRYLPTSSEEITYWETTKNIFDEPLNVTIIMVWILQLMIHVQQMVEDVVIKRILNKKNTLTEEKNCRNSENNET